MTDLRVTTAHVRELAARQGEAAAQITTAGAIPNGTSQRMWMSHGAVCAESNMAVAAAEAARSSACSAMSSTSTGLEGKLTNAAQHYDAVDQAQQSKLDGKLQGK